MISTDRLLWLLQTLLFLSAAAVVIVYLLLMFTTPAMPGPCEWTFTLPDGQKMTATWNECDAETGSSGIQSVVSMFMYWLWLTTMGAVIFCLRRIATYLREKS